MPFPRRTLTDRRAAPALLGLLLFSASPAAAYMCGKGEVRAPNGYCMTPAAIAQQQADRAKPRYQSCPMDFGWDDKLGHCTPRLACPGGMVKDGDHCTPVRRR